jgi:hypothetical protein
VRTDQEAVEQSVGKILAVLTERGLIGKRFVAEVTT